ncbi:MAG: hypothetical protein ACXWFY_02140 [Chthoniobacterales bacterium]
MIEKTTERRNSDKDKPVDVQDTRRLQALCHNGEYVPSRSTDAPCGEELVRRFSPAVPKSGFCRVELGTRRVRKNRLRRVVGNEFASFARVIPAFREATFVSRRLSPNEKLTTG